MLTFTPTGANALTDSAAQKVPAASGPAALPVGQGSLPPFDEGAFDEGDRISHMLFGSPRSVRHTISHLHKLRYAEANDWSRPISTGRPGEVMAILTKRIASE